nr:hypothetical protein [Tanacetum cinerariifolium]
LSDGLSLDVNNPIQTALAYRKHMAEFFKHSVAMWSEIIRLGSQHDNPLVDHGRELLERLTRADKRNAMQMIGARHELKRSMAKKIITVNVIPPDHVDEVPVVEPNQHNDVPVVLEIVLVYEDEDLREDEFEEEEDPQKEDDDMEIDIEEDKNEPELTYPYEEVDPLKPPLPASESEPDDEIEVENLIEHEDKTVPASVY